MQKVDGVRCRKWMAYTVIAARLSDKSEKNIRNSRTLFDVYSYFRAACLQIGKA
jgi:hypothetical protein